MNKNTIVFLFLLILTLTLTLTSCNTRNKTSKLNYMQNVEQVATEASMNNAASNSTLQVGDQLVILVSGRDLDVVKPFNQNYSSGELIQQSQVPGNVSNQGAVTFSGPTYIVDSEGYIDFPFLGKIDTKGKTIEALRDELHSKIKRYVIDPTVNVRLANFKVTVLGEVNRQGEYIVPNGKATLLNALGMAGDLTMYGKRDDVLLVRNIDGNITKERINLLDANFINSPYFHLKQGDVIYVSSNKTREKTAKLDPNSGLYIGIASIVVTILALVFKK
ncbi:polysaccharide biosynthesis/export family protein [Kaistella haifensis]|nr:polysaccharide biosynthesis/export family protein [Kaistella haifensis]